MPNKKITDLPIITQGLISSEDIIPVVDDPLGGVPETKRIRVDTLMTQAPVQSVAGKSGEILLQISDLQDGDTVGNVKTIGGVSPDGNGEVDLFSTNLNDTASLVRSTDLDGSISALKGNIELSIGQVRASLFSVQQTADGALQSTTANSTFATKTSLDDYALASVLNDYHTKNESNNLFATQANLEANYLSSVSISNNFATKVSLANNITNVINNVSISLGTFQNVTADTGLFTNITFGDRLYQQDSSLSVIKGGKAIALTTAFSAGRKIPIGTIVTIVNGSGLIENGGDGSSGSVHFESENIYYKTNGDPYDQIWFGSFSGRGTSWETVREITDITNINETTLTTQNINALSQLSALRAEIGSASETGDVLTVTGDTNVSGRLTCNSLVVNGSATQLNFTTINAVDVGFGIDALADVDLSTTDHQPTDKDSLVWDQDMGHWMPRDSNEDAYTDFIRGFELGAQS